MEVMAGAPRDDRKAGGASSDGLCAKKNSCPSVWPERCHIALKGGEWFDLNRKTSGHRFFLSSQSVPSTNSVPYMSVWTL